MGYERHAPTGFPVYRGRNFGYRLKAVSYGTVFALLNCVLSYTALATGPQGGSKAGSTPAATIGEEPLPLVNLQVLPKDITVATLKRLMRGYERELGVECSYCHVENRDTGELDYVSDENPKKEIARIMIAMLEDINGRHLAQLGGDRRYAADVSCGSCHQGRANPPSWEMRRR